MRDRDGWRAPPVSLTDLLWVVDCTRASCKPPEDPDLARSFSLTTDHLSPRNRGNTGAGVREGEVRGDPAHGLKDRSSQHDIGHGTGVRVLGATPLHIRCSPWHRDGRRPTRFSLAGAVLVSVTALLSLTDRLPGTGKDRERGGCACWPLIHLSAQSPLSLSLRDSPVSMSVRTPLWGEGEGG